MADSAANSAAGFSTWSLVRQLLRHAAPVLIAQLASIGMMVVDTAVLGHVSASDLAAVAIGSGIHVSLVFGLVGILQAVAPVVAHLQGARRHDEVALALQQGFWLALALSLPGMLFLRQPDVLLQFAPMAAEIEAKVRLYLALLAWSLPATLCYRTFYAFCNGLGRGRVLMLLGLLSLLLHAGLAWAFALHGWLGAPRGVAGCALSNIVIAWLVSLAAGLYLTFGPLAARYRPWSGWRRPLWSSWRELLRLGLPMGLSNLVEISAFTLVSLFVAALGATVVAGHRIIANLSALTYMVPLSLAIATLSAVGQAVGARDGARAQAMTRVGLLLAGALSILLSLLLWLSVEPVVAAYTDDAEVHAVALSLILFLAAYQFFDALQTVAGHVLRACRVTFLPMLMQTFCFWGIGLAGGWWLCYHGPQMGVRGFWLASVVSLVTVAAMLLPLLREAMRRNDLSP